MQRKPKGPILPVPADLVRKCPVCGNGIQYKTKQCWRQAERGNVACKICSDDKVRAKTQSQEWRESQSERLEAAWDDQDSTLNSKNYRKALSEGQKKRTDDRSVGGRKAWENRSEESRIAFIAGSQTPESLQKRKDSLAEYWISEEGIQRKTKQSELAKLRMEDPEYKTRCTEKLIAAKLDGKQNSTAEVRFKRLLDPHGWSASEKVAGKYVDFVHHKKKLIFEFFGDWFHAHPRLDDRIERDYEGIHPNKKRWTPVQIREFDRKRNLELECATGYKVFVLWESDIKGLSDEQIIELLKSKSIID